MAKNDTGKARLKEFRLKHKISQTMVAEILGVDNTTICKWEKKNKVPSDYLYHLCFVLGEDPEFFRLHLPDIALELLYAKENERVIYHTGFLLCDREKDKNLSRLLKFLDLMYSCGLLLFVQNVVRKNGEERTYEYIAIRRSVQSIAREDNEEEDWEW